MKKWNDVLMLCVYTEFILGLMDDCMLNCMSRKIKIMYENIELFIVNLSQCVCSQGTLDSREEKMHKYFVFYFA